MKRISMIIIALILISSIITACGGTNATPTSTPTKVRIGTDATYPPFEKVNLDTKQMEGFDIDLMKEIGIPANLDVEFAEVTYPKILEGVSQCQLDGGISAISITDELKKQMSFSDPYFSVGQVVVVKKGNSLITGKDQLTGMVVGTQKGSNSAIEIGKINGAKLAPFINYDIAFQNLIYGMVDAVVTDKITALGYTLAGGNNLKIVGNEFAIENYGIAVCNDKADILKRINYGLTIVRNNGTIARLTQKWLDKPELQ